MPRVDPIVAVVTGASRGIGRGIARVLGQRGATVYVVARTGAKGGEKTPSGGALPGTIAEAAAEVDAAGGRGIAVSCDLAEDQDIRGLFETVRRESGYLNILVNNAAKLNEKAVTMKPFWDAPVSLADILDVGLRCHHVATYYAAPLLLAAGRGLIANISFYADAAIHDPAYYASKAGLDKLASVYADAFRPYGVAAVSLWPGFVGTERPYRSIR